MQSAAKQQALSEEPVANNMRQQSAPSNNNERERASMSDTRARTHARTCMAEMVSRMQIVFFFAAGSERTKWSRPCCERGREEAACCPAPGYV